MQRYNMPNETEVRMKKEQYARCNDMGNRLQLLFVLKIITTVLNILFIGFVTLSSLATGAASSALQDVITSAKVTVLAFELITLGLGIVYGVLTMMMGKYMSEFTGAGVFTIIDALITFAYDFTGANILSLVAGAFGILYVMRFSDGMKISLRGFSPSFSVDSGLALDWDKFKSINIMMLIVMGICLIVALIPVVKLIIIPVALIILVGAFILEIWELILMYKSSVSMKNYIPV